MRVGLVLLAALLVAAPASAAEPARTGDAAVLKLKKLRGVSVKAVAPARRDRSGLRFPARTIAVAGGVGRVELAGALRFRAGRRAATVRALRLTATLTSSALTGTLGRSRITLFSARGRPDLANGVTVTRARAALTRAAAARLKRALKLKRALATARLGTLTVSAASASPPAPPASEPEPIVITPAPTPAPTATPAPSATPSAPACQDRTTTPDGSVDWIGCDLSGAGDLKSWTDYVLRPFPPACGPGAGSIVAAGGATRVDPATAYDHRFPVAEATRHPDGSATIRLRGSVTYTMPAHGIVETLADPVIEIAADGQSGRVLADGASNAGEGRTCGTPPTPYSGEHVLDLDLTAATPSAGGWVRVPARTVPNPKWIGGTEQYAGRPWGSFRFALPA